MGIESTLGSLVLLLKNACFNVTVALTVLVALGNEVRRMRITFRWLEDRHDELTKAWYISLGIFLLLSIGYAYVEHRIDTLVVDGLTVALMAGAVTYLKQRHGKGKDETKPAAHADEEPDEEEFAPRRPLQRVPRDRARRPRRARR